MSPDNSVVNPGPMGWGEEGEGSVDVIQNMERRSFQMLAEARPNLLERRQARQPNQLYIDQLQKLQERNGIEKGYSAHMFEQVVFGGQLRWLRQLIGSCVASGGGRAMTRRMLAEVFLLNDPETLFGTKIVGRDNVCPFLPYSYRAGRHFANINGNSDGSYCSAHTRGAAEFGILPCSATGLESDAFPEPQSTSLYRRWGANNTLLNQFASQGRVYKLVEAPKVDDGQIAMELMMGYKPFMICSSWAFRPDYTHSQWKLANGDPVVIYKRDTGTSWAHNMTIDSIVYAHGRWWVYVDNSWGDNAHKNGSGFWIPFDLFAESWLPRAECQAMGEIDMSDNPSLAA